ncbi:MAG: ABC transporter permease [Bacteroidales bacterium]|nr:ABC transporter permease [Bacteroidales bacterium]
MGKIKLIILREYLTRVRKKSFIIMTILGPLLMAALFVVPVFLAQLEGDTKTIAIVDETGLFAPKFKDSEKLHFEILNEDPESIKLHLTDRGFYALLHIPITELSVPNTAKLYANGQPNIIVTGYVRETMRKEIESLKLSASGIDPEILRSIKSTVNLLTIRVDEGGNEQNSSTELSMVVGYIGGILIYFFIFMYGAQVMRGVIEEKTNRIVEVIVSSVKPFQLMMGKIIGVAMVGLTQFVLWVVFTIIIVTSVLSVFSADINAFRSSQLQLEKDPIIMYDSGGETIQPQNQNMENPEQINEAVVAIFDQINSIAFQLILPMFLFYFIGGYLLYGALFAAIGSAVDNETDTQQFMLPITVPLILSIMVAQFIIINPEGPLAFWLSIIPLTSPVVMMVRLPFGVHWVDITLSITLMIAGFLFATWLAGRIYRTGILMYGKKPSYKELWKWLRYRS